MHFLERRGAYYNVRLGLSWSAVGVNLVIIIFQIVVSIVEFFRLRRKKIQEAKEEAKKVAARSEQRRHYRADDSHLTQLRRINIESNSFGNLNFEEDIIPQIDQNRQVNRIHLEDPRVFL